MNDTMTVEMLETLARLPTDGSDLPFSHQIRSHHIRQAPTLHILHNHPQLVPVQERVNVVDDVRMPAAPHDQNLIDDEILLRLLVQVHLLDSDRQVGAYLVCGIDTAGSTKIKNTYTKLAFRR